MNGFGFIEYKDALDARDVVPGNFLPPSPPLLLLYFWTVSLTSLFIPIAFRTSWTLPGHRPS